MLIEFSCRYCSFNKLYEEDVEPPFKCPDCDGKWYKLTFRKEPKRKVALCGWNATMKSNPRWSDALGIAPSQEADFHKAFPKLDLTFDKEGRCLIKNRHHKKQIMKARGFDEGGRC